MNYQFQNLFRQLQPKTNIGIRTPWQEQIETAKQSPNTGQGWEGLTLRRQQEAISQPEPEQENPLYAAFRNLMAERGQSQSAYTDMLSKAPRREDYERSKWAKIAALATAGLGAYGGDPNAAQGAIDALESPYRRAMGQYDRDLELAKHRAGAEGDDYNRRLESVKVGLGAENTRIDNERLSAKENADELYRQQMMESSGRTFYVRPIDGMRIMVDRNGKQTEIGQDDLTAVQKLELVEAADRRISDRALTAQEAAEKRARIAADAAAARTDATIKAALERDTNPPPPAPVTPAARRTAATDAARDALNTPEFADLVTKGIVKIGPNGYDVIYPARITPEAKAALDARLAQLNTVIRLRTQQYLPQTPAKGKSRFEIQVPGVR